MPNKNHALRYIYLITLLTIGGVSLAQKDNPHINQIRARFQTINNATDYKILTVSTEQYYEITGIYLYPSVESYEAIGYVKNKKVYKIVELGYTASQKMTTEYYFWDNLLIFIYCKTEIASYDSISTSLDFNKLTTIAETRLYIRSSKLIKRFDTGSETYYFEPGKKVGNVVNSPDKLKKWFLKMSK